jgi:hypothetical protein
MSRELLQQSLKLLIAYQDCTMDSYITNKCGLTIQALEQELAKPAREWVGLTDDDIKCILDCGRGGLVDIKKAEQMLKEKNT